MLSIQRTFVLGLALAASAAGFAQPTKLAPRDEVADRLVAEALQKTPELTAVRASIEAAQFRVEPARTLPDPSASVIYQNDGLGPSLGSREGTFLGVMWSQGFPWPGKLALAGWLAQSAADELELGIARRTAMTIEARVRNAWVELQLARAQERLIDERRTTATQIAEAVRERYAAGLAVQTDVIRAEVEVARLDESATAQQAIMTAKAAELNRLIAMPQDSPIESDGILPAEASIPTLQEIVSAVLMRSPELAAANQSIETGRIAIDAAKKNFYPDLVISGGSMFRGAYEMGPMWQVGVGVSIPLWADRRQRNQLAEARALSNAREAESDVLKRELELRTRERMAQLDAARRIASLYREKILPLDELALESALVSYQTGKVPFVSVLEALNALYGDRALLLGRLAEDAKWRIAIDEGSLQPVAMGGTLAQNSNMTTAAAASAQSSGNAPSGSSMANMQ